MLEDLYFISVSLVPLFVLLIVGGILSDFILPRLIRLLERRLASEARKGIVRIENAADCREISRERLS